MPRSLNMNLYLRDFSIAIYQKFDLYYLCLFRLFFGLEIVQFWSVNYASYFRPSEIFSCWDIRKDQFQFLVTFLVVFFLVCKLCKSVLYIITYFKHGKYFIWGFLVFSFLVFSVSKYFKFSFSSNFFCFGNVKVLVCKLYMSGQ